MKTYTLKHIVIGIMLLILTLGFCVVGTGAAKPDHMKGPIGEARLYARWRDAARYARRGASS